jgi:hypothetical protein
MSSLPVTVVELPTFVKEARKVWNDDERADFIFYIAQNPMDGDLIEGTGGFRKIRWGKQNVGKSGGVRVIYYFFDPTIPLYLARVFAKSNKSDLSPAEKNELKSLALRAKRAVADERKKK